MEPRYPTTKPFHTPYIGGNLVKLFNFAVVCGLLVFTETAEASIQAQVCPKSFGTITRSENFESYAVNGSLAPPFTTADFIFSGANQFALAANSTMPNPTSKGLYQNGGYTGRMVIASDDGADLDQIQFDVGEGVAGNTVFAWLEAFNNGASTGYSFNFDVTHGGTVSLWSVGTVFDEVQYGAYSTAAIRNTHNTTAASAASIDNVIAGTAAPTGAAPEPLSLMVWVGLIAGAVVGTDRRTRR
jgi:hypothetical protein